MCFLLLVKILKEKKNQNGISSKNKRIMREREKKYENIQNAYFKAIDVCECV